MSCIVSYRTTATGFFCKVHVASLVIYIVVILWVYSGAIEPLKQVENILSSYRTYLRLGNPMKCQVPCRRYPASTVPISTVTCLVSIATTQGSDTSREKVTPSFVEFDMRREGWACLFIPSLAPKTAAATPTGLTGGTEGALLGGMGRGECV